MLTGLIHVHMKYRRSIVMVNMCARGEKKTNREGRCLRVLTCCVCVLCLDAQTRQELGFEGKKEKPFLKIDHKPEGL